MLHLVGGHLLEDFLEGGAAVDDHLQAAIPESVHASVDSDLLNVTGGLLIHDRLAHSLVAHQ